MCYSLVMIVPKSTNFPPLYLQAIDDKQENAIVTERRADPAVGSIEIFRHFAKESKSERWERTMAKSAPAEVNEAAEVARHD
jgi:hypothetical protein